MGGGATLVQRQHRHDGHFLGRLQRLASGAMNPPSLKAVISLCSTLDRYADDIHYKGGCLLGENFGWSANMLSYSSRAPDPAIAGDRWREIWLKRLEAMPMLLSTWLRHPHRDAYWKHGSICEDYSAIKAAVLSLGGWHDGYRNTPAHVAQNIQSPVKAIVGPWIHKYPHFACAGTAHWLSASGAAMVGPLAEGHRERC